MKKRGRPFKNPIMPEQKPSIQEVEPIINEPIINTEPEQDIRLGFLTPSYVEWFYNNHSKEEFNIKYIKVRNRIGENYFKNV
jgi:hypothetical protein